MVRETSAAPKERINVTFKPATDGAVEEIELPMKVTVLGDMLQRRDERTLLDRKPVNINKNNFDSVMANQGLQAALTVPNLLKDTEEGGELNVRLDIASMRDFEPESIIGQVPELKKIVLLREALVTLKGPLGNLPAFTRAIEKIVGDETRRDQLLREISAADFDLAAAGAANGGKARKAANENK
ncbi:MAG: type VI secretion system contractile sheath small subunit [Deltaproteobacteria bacterium]|jgi:type VI secretion system protein ImpB|nr:type VI secretion system contractile sheath small subunit [Deltaproteobacteria bacterium]